MNKKSIILTSRGLKNVISRDEEFTFIFGEREMRLNNIFAEFLSPAVSHLHHFDPTINTIHYDFKTKTLKSLTADLFTDEALLYLKELSSGSTIEIDSTMATKIRQISIFLCNDELYSTINNIYPIEKNISNIDIYLNEIQIFSEIENFPKRNEITDLIEFISMNIESIDINKLLNFSKKILFMIISNEKLKFKKEDSFVDFIYKIFSNDADISDENEPNIISFFEKVDMSKLSKNKFIEFLQKLNPNEISTSLWENICNGFCSEKQENEEECEVNSNEKEFLYDGNQSNQFNGIISHLTKECGGNVHEKGIINITASSENNDTRRNPKHVVEFNDNKNKFFRSKNLENLWLSYDFKNRKVRPTSYSIRSKPYDYGDFHPKNWVIEGSNTGNEWKILDSRQEITSLNGNNLASTFQIQEKLEKNEFYRFLRIKQTGLNASGSNYLGFSSLEYFGSIK